MPLDRASLADLVARALAEDVGDGDVTTLATVPEGARAVATITQKAPGVVFGLDVAEAAFRRPIRTSRSSGWRRRASGASRRRPCCA